ncbi:MAG TPA: hypothetical protein VEI97_02685, partial [bacterium]|nr:hypothetical protein [bacterium]
MPFHEVIPMPFPRTPVALVLACFLLGLAPALAGDGGDQQPPIWVPDLQKIERQLRADQGVLASTGDELGISHHRMVGTLDPTSGTYSATTTEFITAKIEAKRLHLLLFRDFAIGEVQVTQNGRPVAIEWSAAPMPSDLLIDAFLEKFPGLELPPPLTTESLRSEGLNLQILTITLPRFARKGEAFEVTTRFAGPYGDLDMEPFTDEAIFFNGPVFWFPDVFGPISTFELDLTLPADWNAFSQGKFLGESTSGTMRTVRYKAEVPQGQIVLIAGPYEVERETRNGLEYASFLFGETAEKTRDSGWLDKAAGYIAFFAERVGPYPFESFAVVESRADVGQGYPSFTLLGGHVIGAHFLDPHTLGHEILHSWFGNYVVWSGEGGNWTEGITYYL